MANDKPHRPDRFRGLFGASMGPVRRSRALRATLAGLCGMLLIGTALIALGTGGLFLLLLYLSLAHDGFALLIVALLHLLGILLPVSIAVLPIAATFVEGLPHGRRTLLGMIGAIAGTWWGIGYAGLILDTEAARIVATILGGVGGLTAGFAYGPEPGASQTSPRLTASTAASAREETLSLR